MSSSFLSADIFSTIIKNTPLISIDLIIKDKTGAVLLGERLNRPAKGYWFVPGGRIRKDERFSQAFNRLVLEELGFDYPYEKARFIGPFEHHYSDSVFDEYSSTHYVVLGFEITISERPNKLPCAQHNNYNWFSIDELLDSPHVHLHTKWYFQPNL